jgi:spore germination cell wall hydrolase CwlJ-like protein
MTEITPNGEQDTQIQVPSLLLNALTILLMVVAIVGSVLLLKWAVTDKQSKFEVAASSQITAEMRERQLTCLARNIYYEAGSEPFEGKVAVAQVTINRVESGKFPDDVCKTIYQKNVFYEKVVCQFSWYCDRAATIRPIHKGNYDESMVAAKKVLLEGFRLPSLEDALFYHADYVNPGWKKEKVAKIGRHIFYK